MIKDAQYRYHTASIAPSDTRGSDRSEPSRHPENRELSPAARKNWQRIGIIARRAGGDDLSPSRPATSLDDPGSTSDEADNKISAEERQKKRQRRAGSRNPRRKAAKMMDIQYFLEMVDQKHRYGSNLRKYHSYWKSRPTSQNFFYWLDHGEGKEVELPECDRARLDREQVRYLSKEERLNYLVTVDESGRLRWAKDGNKVWTKDALFTDSMEGIVPIADRGPTFQYNVRPDGFESESAPTSDGPDQSDESEEDVRCLHKDLHKANGAAKPTEVSPAVIFNYLIRGHMKKGHKWIFVSCQAYRPQLTPITPTPRSLVCLS